MLASSDHDNIPFFQQVLCHPVEALYELYKLLLMGRFVAPCLAW